MLVVSDATPLNILIRAGLVHVLPALFQRVVIPIAVQSELSHASTPLVIRDLLGTKPAWLEVRAPVKVIEHGPRGRGEREAISLARELGADLLLADDKSARKAAAAPGIATTGTLGVLERASERGLVDLRTSLAGVRAAGLFLADELIEEAMRRDQARGEAGPGQSGGPRPAG